MTPLLMIGFGSCTAVAQISVIQQHNNFYNDPNDPNVPNSYYYTIVPDPDLQAIVYHGVQGEPFEFESVLLDGERYEGPGDINLITADENAGPVDIKILGHDGHEYGARNVRKIDLSADGVDGSIGSMLISGDLAEHGPVRAHVIWWDVWIDGRILDDVDVDVLDGDLHCAGMRSLYASSGTMRPGPDVTIDGPWGQDGLDTIHIDGWLGTLSVGELSGTVEATELASLLVHPGGITRDGRVVVDSLAAAEIQGETAGTIDVGTAQRVVFLGDLSGLLHAGTYLGYLESVEATIFGDVIVDGSTGGLKTSDIGEGALVSVAGDSAWLETSNVLAGAQCTVAGFLGGLRVWQQLAGTIDVGWLGARPWVTWSASYMCARAVPRASSSKVRRSRGRSPVMARGAGPSRRVSTCAPASRFPATPICGCTSAGTSLGTRKWTSGAA